MKEIWRIGSRPEGRELSEASVAGHVREAIRECEFSFLFLKGQLQITHLAEMLCSLYNNKPIFIADICDHYDSTSSLAKFGAQNVHLVRVHPETSEEQAIALARLCVEHSAGHWMGLAFDIDLRNCLAKSGSPCESRLAVHLCCELDCVANITPQYPITAGGKSYRADFLVHSEDYPLKLVIEVDGHDFHERNKEQAKRDRSRDRAMLADGYTVMRFTGSEVWNEPRRCAREVRSYFESNTGSGDDL